jgi:UrcA family protein
MKTSTAAKISLAGAALAAAIGTFLVCAPAHANGNEPPANLNELTTNISVRFGDLDLNSEHGAKTLFLRLKNAAESACGDAFEPVDLNERAGILQCQQKAMEKAVERVDQPRLTAVYDARFPRERAIVSASLPGPTRG